MCGGEIIVCFLIRTARTTVTSCPTSPPPRWFPSTFRSSAPADICRSTHKTKRYDVRFCIFTTKYQQATADISVRVVDPRQTVLEHFPRSATGRFSHEAEREGDYLACFDNSHSPFASKNVFVEMSVTEKPKEKEGEDGGDEYYYEGDDYFEEEDFRAMKEMDTQQVNMSLYMIHFYGVRN